MRGFKAKLYEGGIATPMIFHWPDGIGRPGRVSQQVGHVADLFPTVLEITGEEYPSEYAGRKLHPLDGRSLLPHIRGDGHEARTICWSYESFSAVRSGKWKAVRQSKNRHEPDGVWQLYDLSEDRSETHDVSVRYPEVVESLSRTWEDWRQDVGRLHKD